MTVTIIVITYNSNHVLPRFFKGLSLAGQPFELIIIDNASRESPISLMEQGRLVGMEHLNKIKGLNIRTIQNDRNLMYTRAVNQGLRSFNTDLVLIMNPDCYGVDEGWLDNMVKYWARYGGDIAGYKLVRDWSMDESNPHPDNPYWEIEHVGAHHPGVHKGKGEEDKGQYDRVIELKGEKDYVTGACIMLSKDTIKKFGLLDEQYAHYQSDREYCFHIRREGGKVMYFPVRMVHLFGKSCAA